MRQPILFSAAADRGHTFVDRWRGQRPAFCCVLAHTDTCLIPGLSAAGLSEALRPLTPAADAEVVLLGTPVCLPLLPSNPLGAPGPAGITRTALALAGIQAEFMGAGLRVWPATECARVSDVPGGDITAGHAVSGADRLYAAGYAVGQGYAARAPYLVLAESVPGGTTTALSLLLALGYAAGGRVSGSMAGNAHTQKLDVACRALRAADMRPGDGRSDPLGAVGEVGDPMQALAAGIARGASDNGCDVLLAGGSQMIGVAALLNALGGHDALNQLVVGTTRWVVDDPAADIPGLAGDISPGLPVLAANLNFSTSRHPGLRAYENYLVKEGVGAGGASIAALVATGASIEHLEHAIDVSYDGLLGRLNAPRP